MKLFFTVLDSRAFSLHVSEHERIKFAVLFCILRKFFLSLEIEILKTRSLVL